MVSEHEWSVQTPLGAPLLPSFLQQKQRGEAGREEGKPSWGATPRRWACVWRLRGTLAVVWTRGRAQERETCMNVVFDGQFRNVESSIAAHERTSRAGDDARLQRRDFYPSPRDGTPRKSAVSALSLQCASVTPLFRGLPFPSRCEKPSGAVCCGIGAQTKKKKNRHSPAPTNCFVIQW